MKTEHIFYGRHFNKIPADSVMNICNCKIVPGLKKLAIKTDARSDIT